MRNLERAVRLFRALVETGSDVQVTSATLWSWPEVRVALGSSDGDRSLLVEMEGLPDVVRDRTLQYCGSLAPLEPKGDVFVFPNVEAADKFVAEMEADLGSIATHLADGIVAAYGETPDAVEAIAGRFGGSRWNGPSLSDAFESVDTDLPYLMIQEGFDPSEVESALIEALWKGRDEAMNEAFFMHAPAATPMGKFKGRLASWASPRPVLGVEPRLFEALRMSGVLPRRLCLLLEADPAAPGVSPPSPGAATAGGQDGTQSGIAQPDTGQPAQSQEGPAKEPPKPTEHVPTQEEGGTAMGQVKLPDGTVVPPDIMRQALAKMLQNLATQVEQGTTNGKPAEKPKDQGAQDKQGEAPEVQEQPPEGEQQPPQQQAQQQPAPAAPPTTQPAAPPAQESITEDLHRALGLLKSPRPADVIAGANLVKQTGFSGQPQSVVERVLDEFDALKGSPNARVRSAINNALEADLYLSGRQMIPVLPEGLCYGDGRECAPGTAVVVVEERGSKVVLRLPTGETVLAPASAVAMVEGGFKSAPKQGAMISTPHRKPGLKATGDYMKRMRKKKGMEKKEEKEGVIRGDGALYDIRNPLQRRLAQRALGESQMDEQLDVGQEDEKVAAGKGFAATAMKLKSCRSHTFDLVTKDLVQLESLAKAIGAKRTIKVLEQTRAKATDFLDMLKETAELLEKANEMFKSEGGKGGDAVEPQPGVTAVPAVPAAPAVPTVPAVEVAVAEALRRVAHTQIPRRIAAGESYWSIVESIHSATADLALSKGQAAEVYDRFNALALHDDGTPEFSVELSASDHRLLESVQRHGGLVRGLVRRTGLGRQTLATRVELQEAVCKLRRHGKVEHGMLADDLEAIVFGAC